MRHRQQSQRGWRWIAMLAVLVNIAFSYFSDSFMPGESIATVSKKYGSLFEPAGYAFAIWVVIYIGFFSYAVYQLLSRQRNEYLFDRIAKPFVFANLLSMAWITTFRMDFISTSMLIILVMLMVSILLYVRIRNVVLRHDYDNWLSMPFSIYMGWICVATIANASILIISQEWQGALPAACARAAAPPATGPATEPARDAACGATA